MTYETVSLTQLTGNLTAYYFLQGLGALFIMVVVGLITYRVYKWIFIELEKLSERSDAKTYYWSNVYALKTGMIKKIADEKEVNLIFPPENIKNMTIDDAYNEMLGDVQNDMKK